jgi:hypothetical protein
MPIFPARGLTLATCSSNDRSRHAAGLARCGRPAARSTPASTPRPTACTSAPDAADDPAPLPAGRSSADCAGGRRDRHDRRPQRQERRAKPALARRARGPTSTASASRCASSSTSTAALLLVNNYDWMSRFQLSRFPPRRRQAFSGQRHAGQGLGQEPARAPRQRDLSYTEFSYMLLQAYDFVHLHLDHGCESADRRQRPVGQHHGRHRPGPPPALACSFTASPARCSPRATAGKMGKTESGAVWLSAARTSPTSSINTGSTSTTPTPANACDS